MSKSKSSYLGLRTVVYHVTDLESAKLWYTDVFDPFGNVLGIIENPTFPNSA